MIVLYCSLVFVCVFFGVSLSKRLSDREKFYLDMQSFLAEFKANLYFRQVKFQDLVEQEIETSHFKKFLISCIKPDVLFEPEYISQKEKDQAKQIILSLGEGGINSLEETLAHAERQVNKRLELATFSKQKYSSVAIKLSFFVGLLLVVLLI